MSNLDSLTGCRPVTFVNQFRVHDSTQWFERVFADAAAFLADQPGFLRYALSRNLDRDKCDRYVNVAVWRDAESLRRAVAQPSFEEHRSRIAATCLSSGELYMLRQSASAG
jgi:heme-degrading monooxygenase HmoA